jgi:hypothetical protein
LEVLDADASVEPVAECAVLFAGGWAAAGLFEALVLVSTVVALIDATSEDFDDAATGWSDSLGRSCATAILLSPDLSLFGIDAAVA